MPTLEGLERRLEAVESALRELQKFMPQRQPGANWLDRVIGSMKDEPDFDGVVALGKAIREADRPEEGQGEVPA